MSLTEPVIEWMMAGPDHRDLPTLQDLLGRPQWMARGACRGMDTDLFVTRRGESLDAAREVCARCPVRAECLAFALADPAIVGTWGGTSARERAILRRRAA